MNKCLYIFFKPAFCCALMFLCSTALWTVPGETQAVSGQDRVKVMVSIAPQKYFVERIGGEPVEVTALLPAGSNPHTFEPRPSQIRALGQADMYMSIGVEYEKALLPRIKSTHPDLTVAHMDRGIEKIAMIPHHHGHDHHDAHAHDHDHDAHQDHSHHHDGPDPHVWLSPDLVMIMADNIRQDLSRILPEKKEMFTNNYLRFVRELMDLDQQIKAVFQEFPPGGKFMVFHPAWGYFARNYGLIQVPVEVEGREPRSADLKELINTARDEGIKVVFVSPQFSKRSAETIAHAIGGETIFVDPLAENWKENMLTVADKFARAINHRH